jgi:NADPH-dependent glutamate synthase beta subunit-like oxidoreductase
MQLGFFFDQTRCTGCYACQVACKDWHDIPAGPASWIRVTHIEEGKFPNLFAAYLINPCFHCADPPCISVCPAEAITKREEDGVVIVDREKCKEANRCGIIKNLIPQLEMEAPCKVACPAHVNVPGYVALIAKGRYKEALNLIRERMPLPGVCGRICSHPCESKCARKDVDEPIDILALKRFASDSVAEEIPSPLPRTKRDKVAIVGSGPAGLAAAYDLVREGYGVTIFEALPVAGGMLAVGIPEYRLPKRILQREIEYIKGLGVEIKTNTALGKDFSLNELFELGYGAIFIAIGAHKGGKLSIPGAELEGTIVGTSFLHDLNLGREVKLDGRVLVVGGGNVAVDCARTASRLGAKKVYMVCLESREDMPALDSEVKEAEKEGVIIYPSRTVTKVFGANGRVSGVECLKLRRMEFDEDGELHIDAIEGSEHEIAADTVIFAIGQSPDIATVSGLGEIATTKRGTIAVNPETMETSQLGVFAGGDAVSGPATFIEAIAAGQKAASYVDLYLKGRVLRKPYPVEPIKAEDIEVEIPEDIERVKRVKIPELSVAERALSFKEVALGFTADMATEEARRCLNCAGALCREVCPYDAPLFGVGENAKMQKCDFCFDRLRESKEPICVAACPMRALDFGSMEELVRKYGEVKRVRGFGYSPRAEPSIVFKPASGVPPF